jgi:hypothetical protein
MALLLSVPAVAPFQVLPELQAIAIAYSNTKLVADRVLPRIRPVNKTEFAWYLQNLSDGFYIPDTKVGRKSQPNQVEFAATLQTGYTKDYFLDDKIPQQDIENAEGLYDPRMIATEYIMYLIKLDRERRVANLVFNPDTYPASNQETLSGTSQFSDFNDSDPIGTIQTAMDSMVMRPNIMTIGRLAWSVLQRHPEILKAVYRNLGNSGIATAEEVARVFELDEIIVGEAWMDSSKRGQTPTLQRLWGKHLSLIYQSKIADNERGCSFGYTVPFKQPLAGAWEDKNVGARGGQVVRAGESVAEIIAAPLCGYFMQNVVQ